MAPGSTLAVNGGTRLVVAAGQTLTLPPGSWANGAGYSSIITPSESRGADFP